MHSDYLEKPYFLRRGDNRYIIRSVFKTNKIQERFVSVEDFIYSQENGKINLGNVLSKHKNTHGIIIFYANQKFTLY